MTFRDRLLRRHRTRPAPHDPAEADATVQLGLDPADPGAPVTPVSGWDLLTPLSPMMALPDQADAADHVRRHVTALHYAGALDGGAADVCDRLIHHLVQQWREQAYQAHLRAITTLNLLTEQGLEHQHRLAQQITTLRDVRRTTLTDYSHTHTVLTGHAPAHTDTATPEAPAAFPDTVAAPHHAQPAPRHAATTDEHRPAAPDEHRSAGTDQHPDDANPARLHTVA